jgi:hypothetical protein
MSRTGKSNAFDGRNAEKSEMLWGFISMVNHYKHCHHYSNFLSTYTPTPLMALLAQEG